MFLTTCLLIGGRIALCAPPTSTSLGHDHKEFYREGFILSIFLEGGSVGFGEVGIDLYFIISCTLLN